MTNEEEHILASACMEVETNIAKELSDGSIKEDECLYRLLAVILEYKKRTLSYNPYQE